MKKLLLLLFLVFSQFTFGVSHQVDVVKIGDGLTANPVFLKTKDGGYLKKENDGDWLFSKDGVSEKKFGSGSGGSGSGSDYLYNSNPSFEDGAVKWTNTGGSKNILSYASPESGNEKYLRFTATSIGDKLESECVNLPDPKKGEAGGMANIYALGGGGNFEIKIFDCDSGDVEISTAVLADTTDWQRRPYLTFSKANKYKMQIIATAVGIIDIDTAYLGSNKGFIAGTYLNSIKLEGGDGRDITANSESIYFAGSGEGWTSGPNGSSFTNGNFYEVQKNNSIVVITVAVGVTGTTTGRIELYKNGVKFKSLNGGSASVNTGYIKGEVNLSKGEVHKGDKLSFGFTGAFTSDTGNEFRHYLSINEQSSETSEAFTPEQANFFISANIGGDNPSVLNSTTPAGIEGSSLDMVLNYGSAKIPCSGTNAATGLTCSTGDESVGISFSAPVSGKYKACFTFVANGSAESAFRIVHTETSSQVVLSTGKALGYSELSNVFPSRICDYFDISSNGENVFRLFSEASSSGTVIADRSPEKYERDINITVELVSHNTSRPVINNMVDTSVKSGVRTESCYISNSGVPVIGSPECDTWIDSVLDGGTGVTGLNLSTGRYKSRPNCTISVVGNNASDNSHLDKNLGYTNSVIYIRTKNNTASHLDTDFVIRCEGAR